MPIVHHLYADEFGSHIGKHSERLKITRGGETLAQAPLIHLKTVTIANRGVSISADAIAACCERGIPIAFMDRQGEVYASLYAAGLVGTVKTRRAQLMAYASERGFQFAAAASAGKIRNQAATLRYWARNRQDGRAEQTALLRERAADVEGFAEQIRLIPPAPVEEVREGLMGLEGNAARLYWDAAGVLLPEEYGWPGRSGRGASDPINSLLNYGYGILYAEVERAIILAGLDPYAGFLHADRPGKPSLALDLIEEFRQEAVDRPVFGLAARRFTVTMDLRGMLSDETRREFARHISSALEGQTKYEGGRTPLRYAIQNQARHLAAFLREDREAYTPFLAES